MKNKEITDLKAENERAFMEWEMTKEALKREIAELDNALKILVEHSILYLRKEITLTLDDGRLLKLNEDIISDARKQAISEFETKLLNWCYKNNTIPLKEFPNIKVASTDGGWVNVLKLQAFLSQTKKEMEHV